MQVGQQTPVAIPMDLGLTFWSEDRAVCATRKKDVSDVCTRCISWHTRPQHTPSSRDLRHSI